MIETTDPESFRLASEYQADLTTYASRQYSAELVDDHARAKQLRRQLRDSGAIGAGAGRLVYEFPERGYERGGYERYVLKLAVPNDNAGGQDGCAQNCREATLWARTESELLMPVVAADPEGYWLVMVRGEPVSDRETGFEAFKTSVSQQLRGDVAPVDVTRDNTVRLDGDCRLCDYGVAPASASDS